MDLPLIAGIMIALVAAVLLLGGVAGIITTTVNRSLQRRRLDARRSEAAYPSTAH